MIGGKKWTWTEFTALVEGNFQSSNERDWNRKALLSLKQGSTPMDTFLTRFDTFQALAQYPEDRLIELLEQNANQQIVERLILEKGRYMTVADFKKDLKEAGSRKQLLNFIKSGTVEWAKTRDPNTMDIDATQSGNNKCFNCSGEHFAKECKKPKLQCSECKFLRGGHKKDCSRRGKCYNSLPKECSFPHLFFSCYISFPGVPFLYLPSLSSYPRTPHIHRTCSLTPTLFLALLLDRGYSLLSLLSHG